MTKPGPATERLYRNVGDNSPAVEKALWHTIAALVDIEHAMELGRWKAAEDLVGYAFMRIENSLAQREESRITSTTTTAASQPATSNAATADSPPTGPS